MKRSLRSWLWRIPVEQEVDEELAFHVEMRTRTLIARGMTPEAARAAALERLGNVEKLKQVCVDLGRKRDREMRLTQWLEEFGSDVRFAVRQLRRAPGFACVAAVTLALGIGANSAMFALVDATLLRPLPFDEPERLVQVWERHRPEPHAANAPLNFRDWEERNHTFENMAAFFEFSRTIKGADGTAERVDGESVTSRFFDVLGIHPVAGRTFLPTDVAQPPNVVVLSEGLWRTRFGADPTLIGRVIRIDDLPMTVVGVVPQFRGSTSLWTIWTELPGMEGRALHFMSTYGRLKRGVILDDARGDLTSIAGNLAVDYPKTNKGWSVTIEPLRDGLIGREVRQTSVLFLGVVGLVLLMCCATVANLVLARMTGRGRELAIRAAIGAGRRRIIAQVLTESLVLAGMGGALASSVGATILTVAPSLIPAGLLPPELHLAFDRRVAVFCAATAILTGVLFGLAPAWQATKTSLLQSLGAEGRTTQRGRFRALLVVGEIAAAVVLLCGAGLLLRTLSILNEVDPGYRARNILTLQVVLPYPSPRYTNEDQIRRFHEEVERKVRAIPGVRNAGWATYLPLDREFYCSNPFEIVGDPPTEPANRPCADYQIVSPTYLETLDIPMAAGRGFTAHDTTATAPVCLVNEAFVRRFFRGRDVIGSRLAIQPQTLAPAAPVVREIVGVVRQVKGRPDEMEDPVQVYVPLAQNPWFFTALVVRSVNDRPEALATAVRQAVARVDDQIALTRVRTIGEVASEATERHRFRAVLVVTFAGLALLLAMVGVFGILAYLVEQRRREFGIRIALGATWANLLGLVVHNAARLIAVGALVGLGLAAVLGQTLAAMLFGVRPWDVVTFASAALVLALTAAAATVAPAWRAVRTNPMVALRSE